MRLVMAFDPGGTTGVAFRTAGGALVTTACKDPNDVYDLIKSAAGTETFVVYERFRAHRVDQYGLHTVRICGGIQALCHVYGLSLTEHVPGERLPFMDFARHALQGRSIVIHEVDATAHLLAWEYNNR